MSILSFPDRGPWGSAAWRGNCSGHIYRELFEQLRPSLFIDPMMGSGTSIEVAREMGIPAIGLDLHQGFDCLADSILEAAGRPGDCVISHPPYNDVVIYSGNVWGDEPHPSDLSRCASEEEFTEKLVAVLLNQRDATTPGGVYGTIIGDQRRAGRYMSYQAELIARLPKAELASVQIKIQHAVQSDAKRYGKMRFPRIMHEYILLWAKPRQVMSVLATLAQMARQNQERVQASWKAIVRNVLTQMGGEAHLSDIYEAVARHAPDRVKSNANWQPKVRQVLNQHRAEFDSVRRGVWRMNRVPQAA